MMSSNTSKVNKCSDNESYDLAASILESLELDREAKEHELFHRAHVAIFDTLCEITKNGEQEEPPLMYLKKKDGSPILSYNASLRRRSVKFVDRLDLETILRLGTGGEFKLGFCRPEEIGAIEIDGKRAAWQREISNERLEALCEHADTYPQRALEALFLLGRDASEEVKDFFRGDDLAKETTYLNSELAKRVRQLAYPPFPPETSDEKLVQIGLAWHLDDPEIARWMGVDPIPEFSPAYDFDVCGDPQKAAAWLLKDEDIKEFGEDGEVITTYNQPADAVLYLAGLQKKEPLEYARLAKKLAKILDISKKDFEAFLLDKTKIEKEPVSEILLEDLPRIKDQANRIIAADQGFSYCVQSWNRSHHGDTPVGELLFMQRCVQCCINTRGVHVHLVGPSAAGKSSCAKEYSRRTPEKYMIDATISPKLLYYKATNMPDGCTVILDDTEIIEPILSVYKKSTTNFQEGAELESVLDGPGGKGKQVYTMKMKPRISFVNTSVYSQEEDQARDRAIVAPVFSSPDRIEEIKGYMAHMFVNPRIEEEVDEIAICKAIISDMANHLWAVRIPFADRIRLKGETRAMGVFLDLICASAAWHYTRREKIAAGAGFTGFFLVATEEDFYEAKRIFEGVHGHSREKLSDDELKVLKVLTEEGWIAREGGKSYRLLDFNELQEKVGMPPATLRTIINGRKLPGGQRGDGLDSKIPQLHIYDTRKEIKLELPGGNEYSDSKKKLYGLPEDFVLSDVWSRASKDLVSLAMEKA